MDPDGGGAAGGTIGDRVVVSEVRGVRLPVVAPDELRVRCPPVTAVVRSARVACGPSAAPGVMRSRPGADAVRRSRSLGAEGPRPLAGYRKAVLDPCRKRPPAREEPPRATFPVTRLSAPP